MKDPRIAATAAELRRRESAAGQPLKSATVIVDARYAKAQDAIVVRLNTGSTFIIPAPVHPGLLKEIAPAALRKLEIEAPGKRFGSMHRI